MSEEARELIVRLMIVCVAVTWLVILWRMDQSDKMPNFSFRNLIATRDGYPDRVAVMEIGAFLGMTGALVVLTLRDKLTEWFCLAYVGAFALRGAHSAYLKAVSTEQKPKEPGK